jgi:glycosyltransferase 2 family protein
VSPIGRRVNWKGLGGVLISVAFLVLALWDVDLRRVVHEFATANLWWLLAATTTATGTIAVRAWRWKPLLEPILPRPRFRPRFAGTFIRFAVNNIMPARVGEFAGAYALSRMESISASGSFGSLVVERILDAVVVVLLLFISMALPGFPTDRLEGSPLLLAARLMLLAVAALTVALLAMLLRPGWTIGWVDRLSAKILPDSWHRRLIDSLHAFVVGVGSLREPRLLARALFASAVVWIVSALSFVFALRAFAIETPLAAALFLQSVIAMAVAIPSAPGFFGAFEAAARFGLVDLWGVGVNKAVGFAIGLHLAGFIPVTLIGLYYIWSLGLSLREMEASEQKIEAAVEANERPPAWSDEPGG